MAWVLTEIYYPTVDRPQVRVLEFVIAYGASHVYEESRHLQASVEYIDQSLGCAVVSGPADGSFTLRQEVITHPAHRPYW